MHRTLLEWLSATADFFVQRRLLVIAALAGLSWAFFWSLFWLASLVG
ncbi:hypothetical protein [Devosia geojensis]|nr:hypothetical protein [Devosia geojensis]